MTSIEHPVEVQTVAGHQDVTQTALMEAGVTAITGTLSAAAGGSTASVEFVPNGETAFTLPVGTGEAIYPVTVDAGLKAVLNIPIPPLTVLTHHPERIEERTETVSLYRPGASDSDSDSETITVTHEDGTTTEHTVSDFLDRSELAERRAFIESFVREIVVMPGAALLRYTIPITQSTRKAAVLVGGEAW